MKHKESALDGLRLGLFRHHFLLLGLGLHLGPLDVLVLLAHLLHELVVVLYYLAALVVDEVLLVLHLSLVVLVLALLGRVQGYSKVVASDIDVGVGLVGVEFDGIFDRLADPLEVELELLDEFLGVGLDLDLLLEVVDAVELFDALRAPHLQLLHQHLAVLCFIGHLMHLLLLFRQVLQL